MSITIGCALMVGLPYAEFLKQSSMKEYELDDLIDCGELDVSSIHYDSRRETNIVGKFLVNTDSFTELPEDFISKKVNKIDTPFCKKYPKIEFSLYLVNNII